MGSQSSSISRDSSLATERQRFPEDKYNDASAREPMTAASTGLKATSNGARQATPEQEHRRRDGIAGQDALQPETMQSLSAELNQRPPTWEYRIDDYGKVVKRTRTPTMQKLKEEPLVPLGILGTVGILFMASREFQRGDSHQMNRYLWWRVYAQGATIAAMVVGSIYYESTRALRVEQEARSRGWPVEEMRHKAGWSPDGETRLSGRRPPSFFDPFKKLASALSR